MGAIGARLGLFSLGMLWLGSLVGVDAVWAQGEVSFIRTDFGVGGARSVTVGDFNGDGHLDLAVASHNADTVSIWLGQGDGTFMAAPAAGVGAGPIAMVVGEFNGDGHLDLAVATHIADTVSIWLGQGDGTFTTAPEVSVGDNPVSVVVGEFNGDGHLDLAVANVDGDTVSIRLGRGDGTFTAASDLEVGRFPSSIAMGDFNSDGRLDLSVGSFVDETVSIWLGQGDGTFVGAPNVAVGGVLSVGEFNGDGHLDLAVAFALLQDSPGTVFILLGRGDGTFAAASAVGVGAGPALMVAGDFNSDGHPDLATANAGSATISIVLGRGDGTFATAQDFGVGSEPFSVSMGDFNSDDQLDLATANFGDSTVSILLNNTSVEMAVDIDIKHGRAERLGTASAKVTIEGQLADASLTDLDLGASTVTITSVLNEAGVGLVAGASLPLTLEARPGSDADGATFETPGGARPKVRVDMSRREGGVVSFRLVVEFAPSHKPATCAGTPRTTPVMTSFQIDPAQVSATTTQPWQCLMGDSQLRVPVP